ncbi:methylenetetrahydrofolate reductase [NAD(P)H] [Ahrensia kielensis]|uniref:Methylenetetrahydrofolate reductase n=1 Tax=Ahrensia kielensis TaxID=76980 RepID=A0ABU9T381_9HYPH
MTGSILSRTHGAAEERNLRISFEFFPPKNDAMEETLAQTITKLAPLSPDFISVTYGAGGSTRDPSRRTLAKILEQAGVPAAAHLTCVGSTKAEVDEVIRDFASMGISRFVALRGDPETGMGTQYVPTEGGYENAADLVLGLKATSDFDVSVAAYPEKHPESPDFDADIEMLKRKVDNGANRAITQFFFENDLYERYVERVRAAGINVPIVPGILPIHNFKAMSNFAQRCQTNVPAWLADRFSGLENDAQTHAMIATAIAADQVTDLVDRGVTDFHFYTMNRPDLVFALCKLIGIKGNDNSAWAA